MVIHCGCTAILNWHSVCRSGRNDHIFCKYILQVAIFFCFTWLDLPCLHTIPLVNDLKLHICWPHKTSYCSTDSDRQHHCIHLALANNSGSCQIFLIQWTGKCPPNLPLPPGESRPTPNTWFLGATHVHNPSSILIYSANFSTAHSCDQQTDTHTDHRTEVTMGWFLHCMHAMCPNNRSSINHTCKFKTQLMSFHAVILFQLNSSAASRSSIKTFHYGWSWSRV